MEGRPSDNCGKTRVWTVATIAGQFLSRQPIEDSDDIDFTAELRGRFNNVQSVEGSKYGERRSFIFKDLIDQVFMRDNPNGAALQEAILLQQLYKRPYFIKRADKIFVVRMDSKDITIL